eukprot:TRINITY_DN5397_c0_g1_i1.p1 TRINITY_DN5397_c0_g1~~TRINITY_DN5397_c0_g1_i1.p1  ORF type:complete len:224 (+),score=59.76 TRINITY_DN5397_c0_g1_i1:50-673(+)
MASTQSVPMNLSLTTQRNIGLSDASEQRWRQLTEGRHLLSAGAGLLEEEVHNDVRNYLQQGSSLAQVMGFACRPRPMHQEYDDVGTPDSVADLSQEAHLVERDDEDNAQQLQSLRDVSSFVDPDGEEWHMIDGCYVKLSRAEMQQLIAQAEASESGDEYEESLADTSYCSGSFCGSEDAESTDSEDDESTEAQEIDVVNCEMCGQDD